MRKLILLFVVVILGMAGAYVAAGFMPGPSVVISKPGKFAGASVPLEFQPGAPGEAFSYDAYFEQNGVRTLVRSGSTNMAVSTTISAAMNPGLKVAAGPAKVIVTASRRIWKIRTVSSEASTDVTIRLEKPRVSVVSTKHYINLGGSEMVVYRVTPRRRRTSSRA